MSEWEAPKRSPDKRKGVLGDRFWRVLALLVLCFLVYYFSFDHGRSTMKARYEREVAENEALRVHVALLSAEVAKLKIALDLIPGAKTTDPIDPAKEDPFGPLKFAARVGEDKPFFNNRLILTVVDINNLDKEAAVRLHFVAAAHRETALVKVGEPLIVPFEGRDRQFFLDQLKGSVAFFSLTEAPLEKKAP